MPQLVLGAEPQRKDIFTYYSFGGREWWNETDKGMECGWCRARDLTGGGNAQPPPKKMCRGRGDSRFGLGSNQLDIWA